MESVFISDTISTIGNRVKNLNLRLRSQFFLFVYPVKS